MSRLNVRELAAEPFQALVGVDRAIRKGPLDAAVRELVKIRASQLNGCLFCIDMHIHDAREQGETEDRVHQLPAWQESRLYTEAERAALAYTDAATRLGEDRVSDEVWDEVAARFTPDELGYLVMLVATINAFNRISAPMRTEPPVRS
jgi:AhpD family alkylhydroperoxidase